MNDEFMEAIREIQQEKNIDEEVVLDAFRDSLIRACENDFNLPEDGDVQVDIDLGEGNIDIWVRKEVVKEPFLPDRQVDLDTARQFDPDVEFGESVLVPLDLTDLSRRATQTLKQVLHQRIREGEERKLYDKYRDQMLKLINGLVQRTDEKTVYVNLDNETEAILPYREQVESDDYSMGNRMKFLIVKVELKDRGLLVVVSRTHPMLIERLFQLHIPEVHDGLVEVIDVAREAGRRSKVAVQSHDPTLDPIGTCVGPQGSRIQSIVQEINGEKIDIIPYDDDVREFIKNALSPAEVTKVNLVEDENTAQVVVPEDQLSLAIGKNGQNARLTAKLCDWSIDIYSEQEFAVLQSGEAREVAAQIFKDSSAEEVEEFSLTGLEGVGPSTAEALEEAGFSTPEAIIEGGVDSLTEIEGIGTSKGESIVEQVGEFVQSQVKRKHKRETERKAREETPEEIKKSIFSESGSSKETEEEESEREPVSESDSSEQDEEIEAREDTAETEPEETPDDSSEPEEVTPFKEA